MAVTLSLVTDSWSSLFIQIVIDHCHISTLPLHSPHSIYDAISHSGAISLIFHIGAVLLRPRPRLLMIPSSQSTSCPHPLADMTETPLSICPLWFYLSPEDLLAECGKVARPVCRRWECHEGPGSHGMLRGGQNMPSISVKHKLIALALVVWPLQVCLLR